MDDQQRQIEEVPDFSFKIVFQGIYRVISDKLSLQRQRFKSKNIPPTF